MLVVNLIDKDRVRGEDGFGDSRAIWRARLFLFISFALMAGGLAGSVVSISFRHFFETFLSPRVQNVCLTRVFIPDRFSPVRLNPQVHPQQLPRDVQVLRLLQRFAEHWVNALRSRALDIPEHQRRVRVQPHHINTPSFPTARAPASGGSVWIPVVPFPVSCFYLICIHVVPRARSFIIHRNFSSC